MQASHCLQDNVFPLVDCIATPQATLLHLLSLRLQASHYLQDNVYPLVDCKAPPQATLLHLLSLRWLHNCGAVELS
jgi:hypothetical protein